MATEPSPRPRVLSALLALFGALPVTLVLSVVVTLVAFGVATDFDAPIEDVGDIEEWMPRLTPDEFIHLLIFPAQLLLLGLALCAAFLSREPMGRRLGLVRPRVSWAWVPLFCLGSFFVAGLGELWVNAVFDEPSEHLERIAALILEPEGLLGVYVVLSLSLPPGFCEELFYRGYVQQRLQRRWPAVLAIGLPGVVFALSHMDPMHSLGVLPLGLWFGLVAWGTRSVLPAMVCHAVSNGASMLLARSMPEEESAVFEVVGLPAASWARRWRLWRRAGCSCALDAPSPAGRGRGGVRARARARVDPDVRRAG